MPEASGQQLQLVPRGPGFLVDDVRRLGRVVAADVEEVMDVVCAEHVEHAASVGLAQRDHVEDDVRLDEIEILAADTGQPRVTLSGKILDLAAQKGIRSIQVSLSYETEYAVAFALAEGD